MGYRRLLNNAETLKYLDTLPRIYMVGCWMRYGVWDFPLAGWKEVDGNMLPLVYNYNDKNGTADEFDLVTIDYVTTGQIIMWTQSKYYAELVANALNTVLTEENEKV